MIGREQESNPPPRQGDAHVLPRTYAARRRGVANDRFSRGVRSAERDQVDDSLAIKVCTSRLIGLAWCARLNALILMDLEVFSSFFSMEVSECKRFSLVSFPFSKGYFVPTISKWTKALVMQSVCGHCFAMLFQQCFFLVNLFHCHRRSSNKRCLNRKEF